MPSFRDARGRPGKDHKQYKGCETVQASEALTLLRASDREPAPCWWLVGPDNFVAEGLVAALSGRLGPEVLRRRAYGSGESLAEMAFWLRSTGFFAEPRLLVWRDAELKVLKQPAFSDLKAAAETTHVLVVWTEKATGFQDLLTGFQRVDVEYLKGPTWTAFVQRAVREIGLTVDREAERELAERTRPYGHHLMNSLRKLKLLGADGRRLAVADIEREVSPLGTGALYLVSDAVLARDVRRAYAELTRQLTFGAEPLVLLVVMARQMILLESWLQARATGRNRETFLKEQGLSSWQFRAVQNAQDLWQPEEVAYWIERASQADLALKNSRGDGLVWLSSLVLLAERAASTARSMRR